MIHKEYTDWTGFGDRVKNARQSIGMTVQKLADKTYRSENFINRIENGQKSCSIHTLYQFTQALKVSADELLFGEKPSITDYDDKQIIINILDKCDEKQLEVLKDIILTVYHNFDELKKSKGF